MKVVVERAKQEMPHFFAGKRIEYLQTLFYALDADLEGTLDADEISPLLEYIIQVQYNIKGDVPEDDLAFLMEFIGEDSSGDISFSEFVLLVMVIVTTAPKVLKMVEEGLGLNVSGQLPHPSAARAFITCCKALWKSLTCCSSQTSKGNKL